MNALLNPTWQPSVAARKASALISITVTSPSAVMVVVRRPMRAGEVEDLAEAAARLDDVELLAEQRDADLAFDEQVEAVALVGLLDDRRFRFHRLPAADPHDFPERDVVEVLEERHVAQLVELLRVGSRGARQAQRA